MENDVKAVMMVSSQGGSIRWALADENGVIIDDNNKDGYRSRYSAYEAWYRKQKEVDEKKDIERRKRLVHEWITDHRLYDRLKSDSEHYRINASYFRTLLELLLIDEDDLPFTCSELSHWWML